ncbi:unnamed protein product [Phaedon cochleariae]|uniref:Uncharacterized protein n=1 Tax=Phaedon cochleariae TaxID=80249 RepID=A0A9P0DYM4_PHACE|nr:unnamed protein product [Phaedon cochleariae]
MGKFFAVLPALLLILAGYQVFRKSADAGNGPLVSTYIFLTALFLLLYDLRLYPKQLRKLDGPFQTVIEFLIAAFLMENIIMDFWFPIESVINKEILPRIAELIEESFKQRDWDCQTVCEVFRSETTALVCSYFLSIFFLLAVLHAIRAIDLRALQDGPSCFFGDIAYRLKRFYRKKMKAFGFGGKRRVKIKESVEKTCRIAKSKKKSERQFADDPCHDEIDYDGMNMEEQDYCGDMENYQFDDDSCKSYSDFDMAGDDDF